jgi:pyruvate kinase
MDRSRTKQICTIGPASAERIPELVAAGMDVARINFAHGNLEEHREHVHAVRAAAHAARRSVAVMADLPGPKLRLGLLEGGAMNLEQGATFTLFAALEAPGTAAGALVETDGLATRMQVEDRILLQDGAVELRVTAIEEANVQTEVVRGGPVRSRGGVNVPSERLGVEGLTDGDREALPGVLDLRVDLIAQSFVRTAADIEALRALIPADGPRLVAKIETHAAVENFDAIAAVADGIMVARGDLGVDLPFARVPLVQKDLIARATAAGRFSIVATQMLVSMVHSPRPTRAEASDIANAVFDGADAVMLSEETAIGTYPVEALQAMVVVCQEAEQDGSRWLHAWTPRFESNTPAQQIVRSASAMVQLSDQVAEYPGAIWCFTRTGKTAELLSLQRPRVPIMAFTLSPVVARRLAVRNGVIPMVLPANGRGEPLIARMEHAWRGQRGTGNDHDTVVLVTTSSQPEGINRLELHLFSGRGG